MVWWLLACVNDLGTVEMSGVVHDAPDAQGNLVEGATLSVVDSELAQVDEAVTAADGSFSVGTPAGQPFFLTLAGDGFVSTSFSGTAGIGDFTAGDGYPWIVPPTWVDELRAEFSACPSVAAEGAVVAGDVRLYIQGIESLQTLPQVDTARVTVYPAEGDASYAACYLDDDGASVADGEDTGRDGKFAVFGVPAGGVVVEIVFEDGDGMYPSVLYSFVVADGGFVPLYPALVYEGTL